MKLTDEQNAAVFAEGSIAVTAGAGTGKTAMLAERYVHHVTSGGLSPLEVVAVTFTEKAASELRSRIRVRMLEEGRDELAAEVDAAQISTIHAMAARICREFYSLAGIPPDFVMLDETDADIWLAEWFDHAMNAVDPGTIKELGYTWLRGALRLLLADPFAAKEALKFGEAEWKQFISEACEKSLIELIGSECWKVAEAALRKYRGADGDKLEAVRINVISAMSDIVARRNLVVSLGAFAGFRSNGGLAKNWREGLVEVRDCLVKLREPFSNCQSFATLEFGPADAEVCRRVDLLKIAFNTARGYIAKMKLDKKVLDFGDLEMYALEILKSPAVVEHYRRRWKAILVDEFQDTNPVQEKILDNLAANAKLTVVGDEKQSIYGFRRADPAVFGRMRERIGNSVGLSRSFRTHGPLIDLMNGMFAETLGELHQPLAAARSESPHDGPHIIAAYAPSADGGNVNDRRLIEGRYIACEIRRLLDERVKVFDKDLRDVRAIRPADIAILSRTRSSLDIYIDALLNAGIPAVNTGGGNLLETREARDATAVLEFAVDPNNDIALMTLLRGPFFALSDKLLFALTKGRQIDESWWSLLSLADGDARHAREILNRLLESARGVGAERLIQEADELTGYTGVIANLEQGERRMADWLGFQALLRRFASMGRSDVLGAAGYLRKLNEAETVIPRPPLEAGDAVSLMTIHGSKGLEWPVVFVPDLARDKPKGRGKLSIDSNMGVAFPLRVPDETGKIDEIEPSILRLIKDRKAKSESDEARRILYVAITRARDRVYLTAAGDVKNDFEFLRPGIEAAGLTIDIIDAENFQVPDASIHPIMVPITEPIVQTEAVPHKLKNIPVTGLQEYASCPRRFKYRYIDGHPGVGEGAADARTIGSLAHTALELDIESRDGLRPFADGAADALVDDALLLASNFRNGPAFGEFRINGVQREVPVSLPIDGVTLNGVADLVGDDFVLDFKTDAQVAPDEHVLQLWAYAKALEKPRAFIAYLRGSYLHLFGHDKLKKAAKYIETIIGGIRTGDFDATPSEKTCGRCVYRSVCKDAMTSEAGRAYNVSI